MIQTWDGRRSEPGTTALRVRGEARQPVPRLLDVDPLRNDFLIVRTGSAAPSWTQPMTIYVNADACPVKAEIERVGARHRMPIVIVSNGGIRPWANPLVETVIVAERPDEADKWIAERAGTGDVVVTGDIPLAAKCVETGAQVLKPDGEALSARNIGNVLATRDLMTDLRAADPFRQGGGQGFTKADRSRFLDALELAPPPRRALSCGPSRSR
jgi:uncharacterized protein